MAKLRFNITMSVDGYVAGPEQSVDDPLGKGGMEIHKWALASSAWRDAHGVEGEATDTVDDERIRLWKTGFGATIMGRNMFGPVRGEWGDEQWNGWWGADPPFHHPVFVLTHHARDPQPMDGGTTFHFVTGGIEDALEQAAAAANGLDVHVSGGGSTVRQYLRAGLIDDFEVHVAPILLGAGERLFEDLGGEPRGYECVELVSSPLAAHYRFVRG